jgi:hypothetical protein
MVLAAALVTFIVVASAPAELRVAATAQDEGTYLVYPDLILHGAVAHRDFQTFYGPGMTWLIAAAYIVGGSTILVERMVGLSMHLAIALLIVLIAARWGSRVALASGAVAAILLTWTGPSATPALGGFILALMSVLALSRGDRDAARASRTFALAGMLGALALTFRPDMAPAVALSALPFIIHRRLVQPYMCGALVGLIPLATHVLIASPRAVVQNIIVDGVLRQSSGRHLPIPPVGNADKAALALALGSLILGLVASGVAWRRESDRVASHLILSSTLFSLGYVLEALQRDDRSHTLGAELVAVSLLPVYLCIMCKHARLIAPRARRATFAAVSIVIIAGGAFAVRGVLKSSGVLVANQGRTVFVSSDNAVDVEALLPVVDRLTKPGQRLFVGPLDMRRTNYNDTFLYFLLPNLHPASYYLEMEPLTANRADSRLAADVASADIVVLTSKWDSWSEPNQSSIVGSARPNIVIMKAFCPRATIGVYHVFTRCER